MDCDKLELFYPNYLYLNHISSFMYDELLAALDIFNNQVLELNRVVAENLENETKVYVKGSYIL